MLQVVLSTSRAPVIVSHMLRFNPDIRDGVEAVVRAEYQCKVSKLSGSKHCNRQQGKRKADWASWGVL